MNMMASDRSLRRPNTDDDLIGGFANLAIAVAVPDQGHGFTHGLKYRQHLVKGLLRPANHDRQRRIDGPEGPA